MAALLIQVFDNGIYNDMDNNGIYTLIKFFFNLSLISPCHYFATLRACDVNDHVLQSLEVFASLW